MKYKTEFVNYTENEDSTKNIELNSSSLDYLGISYDGGRLIININGQDVFTTIEAGNDFSFELINKNWSPKNKI